MAEPTMYPSTLFPTNTTECHDFAELRAAVEGAREGLNAVVSWHLYVPEPDGGEDFHEYEPHYPPEFVVLVFHAERGITTQFRTTRLAADEVEAWLDGYVRPRVLRWYGWAEGGH